MDSRLLKEFDEQFYEGEEFIGGVDEAGRGSIAGPVVAAVVLVPRSLFIPGVNDSKKLKKVEREELFKQIIQNAIEVKVGIVGPKEIDTLNIYNATKKAMYKAIKSLKHKPKTILIDGMYLREVEEKEKIKVIRVDKGDAKSFAIASASIVAKVIRDRIMDYFHNKFPQYKWNENKGYPTPDHKIAIYTYGLSPLHRKTYKPVREYLEGNLFNI